jgi:hypothetical protein
MTFRPLPLTAAALLALALTLVPGTASAQQQMSLTDEIIVAFLKGHEAEKPELAKVETQIDELETKLTDFRKCLKDLQDVAKAAGKDLGGISGRVAIRAKCGASNADGFLKDRAKLLEQPEKVGAAAAGMKTKDYAMVKELSEMFLYGSRAYPDGSLKALEARASDLSTALGIARAQVASGGGAGGRSGGGFGGLGAHGMGGMFTADMTWAYVGYLWGIMYMSGATMFEQPYQAGQWTNWEITDATQPDEKLVLERALLSRAADKSEWWRVKTIMKSAEHTDTITLESQFKPMDESGMVMQVVRMRGKMPGDTEGKELIVPQQFSMLGASALFPFKPTPESVAGATVGTETIGGFSSKHVKFGAGQGSMEWWLADQAPGGVAKVQFTGQDADEKWTMLMTGSGNGAQSELGVQ